MEQEQLPISSIQENLYLRTFPFIRQLTAQKLSRFCFEAIEDITQQVMLKLFQWKTRRVDRELSQEEWLRLANTATQNEIRRYYANQKRQQNDFPREAGGNGYVSWLIDKAPKYRIEGNTDEELRSLLFNLWKTLQLQTQREKYALLFGKVEIIRYLILYRCCTIDELAEALELTKPDFLSIYKSLPMPDQEIAGILGNKLNRQITSETIWKARQRARKKLEQAAIIVTNNSVKNISINLLMIMLGFYTIINEILF